MTWVGPNGQIMGEAPTVIQFPKFQSIDEGLAEGESNYNGLQVFLNSRGIKGIQMTAAYTWSHTLSDSEGAFGTGSNNYFIFPTAGFTPGVMPVANQPLTTNLSLHSDYGSSDQDQRQVFSFSAIGDLPFGKGKRFASNIPTALDEAIGGWHLNTIVSLQSGQPFSITTASYYYPASNSLEGASLTNFANKSGQAHYTKSPTEWFDPSLYSASGGPQSERTGEHFHVPRKHAPQRNGGAVLSRYGCLAVQELHDYGKSDRTVPRRGL